jgi:hypothetical protein
MQAAPSTRTSLSSTLPIQQGFFEFRPEGRVWGEVNGGQLTCQAEEFWQVFGGVLDGCGLSREHGVNMR